MSREIFISHAKENKEIADKLVDLLETGVGVHSDDIFCSSLEGMGIPSGANFIAFIKEQISEPKLVILLLTPQYFASEFCLCEMGASWVLSHRIMPLLVEPLKYEDIKSVLTGVQVLKIHDKADLNELQREVIEEVSSKSKSFARWEKKRDQFLDFSVHLDTTIDDEIVTKEKYDEIKKKYSEAASEVGELLDELGKRDVIIEKLRALKDAEEVAKVIAEEIDDLDQFDLLKEDCKNELRKLPAVVVNAIFHYYRGENLPQAGIGDDYKREEIRSAIENDYLEDVGSGLDVVTQDPKVARAIVKLDEFRKLLDDLSQDPHFCDFYEKEYDHRLEFQSMRFWNRHLM